MDIIGFEKSSIATAVIHRFGGEIAAKFGERFRHDSGEPDDAAHFEVFGREGAGVECVGGGLAVLLIEEVVAARVGDQQEGGEVDVGSAEEIFDRVVDVHCVEPDRGEFGECGCVEKAVRCAVAVLVLGDGVVPDGFEAF